MKTKPKPYPVVDEAKELQRTIKDKAEELEKLQARYKKLTGSIYYFFV